MTKIVIWFYVGVFFLEMNLMAACSLVNPNWPVRGFGSVQILAGTVIVDFLSAIGLVGWLLTPKTPTPHEPIDLRKTLDYWRPSHFLDGPYPETSEFVYVALFVGMLLILAAVPAVLSFLWSDAPLPVGLREALRVNGMLFATGPLLFAASISEYLAVSLVRRLRWRGPPMDQKQLDEWKAENPGAPMPWERGRRGSTAKEDDLTGKRKMPGDEV